MRKSIFILFVFLLFLSNVSSLKASERVVVAYVTSWSSIAPDPHSMTHINYAFGHVTNSYNGVRIDNEGRLQQMVNLKNQNPNLKVLLSIGGWGSGRFSEMADSETYRLAFAADCQRVVEQFGLDGIDIDWEYPTSSSADISSSPRDKANYNLLMRDIRNAIGSNKLLTLASAANANYYDFDGFLQYVDFINIMAYDMGTPPSHHATLYSGSSISSYSSAHSAVEAHLNKGVPANKLVLGVPFYGRGNAQLGNFIDYKQIITKIGNGYTRKWDDVAKVPYLVADNNPNILACGYDDPQSLAIKCQYIIDKGLLGGMYWDYNGDDASGSLRYAMRDGLMSGEPTQKYEVTLKVIDKTKGTYTNDVLENFKDKSIYAWVGYFGLNGPFRQSISNTGDWYANFFDGYTGGKLEKTADEWIWAYTFEGEVGNYEWNPYKLTNSGNVGDGIEFSSALGAKSLGDNIGFSISSSGDVTGETVIVVYSSSSAQTGDDAFGQTSVGGDNSEEPEPVVTDWITDLMLGGAGNFIIHPDNSVEVIVENAGTVPYAVYLYKDNISMPNGGYKLTFRAKADAPRDIQLNIGKGVNEDPWFYPFMDAERIGLTNQWETYTILFSNKSIYQEGKVAFELGVGDNLGGLLLTKVYVEDFTLEPYDVSTSGNNNIGLYNSLNVYPNPAEDVVYISVEEGGLVSLYNSMGILVKNDVADDGVVAFDVSQLSNGLYLVKSKDHTVKLIIK